MDRFRPGFVLLVLLAPLPDAVAAVTQAQVSAAAARGLDWIERHPASVQDGGLPDLLDEAVGFRVLSTLSGNPATQERFRARFGERMARLRALPEFTQWERAGQKRLTDYYYLVLAAYLMQQAGTPSDLQALILAPAQWVLANSPRGDPTKRLTIALFLQRLHQEPVVSLPAALAASRIERVARGNPPVLPATGADPQQRRAASLELYALVHEIIALTDFGRDPVPPWLADRQEPLKRFLVQAVAWASAGATIDLLSELLLTARFIDAPLQGVLQDALQRLLSSQQADGSWGPDPTTGRANRYRHAAFTATTALRALEKGVGDN